MIKPDNIDCNLEEKCFVTIIYVDLLSSHQQSHPPKEICSIWLLDDISEKTSFQARKLSIPDLKKSRINGLYLSFSGRLRRYCTLWPDDEEYRDLPTVIQFCGAMHPDIVVFSELCKSIPFFIAMVWNIYMYARIIYALTIDDNSLAGNSNQQNAGMASAQASRFKNQVARLLIVNGSLFFMCQVRGHFKTQPAVDRR